MSNLGARGGRIVTQADAGKVAVAQAGRRRRFSPERVRLSEDERKRIILEAAMRLIERGASLVELKWINVAEECELKTSVMTARRTFDQSVIALRRAVAELGRSRGNARIIEQGVRFGLLQANSA
jgi:hypothetical protein